MYNDNLKFKIFGSLLIYSILIFIFYFIYEIKTPNYFICNEIISHKLNILKYEFLYNYPESCDEKLYHIGFIDLNQIFDSTFNYAERPLYILFVGLIYRIFQFLLQLLVIDNYSILLFSNFIAQILIVSINVLLYIKVFVNKKNKINFEYLLSLIFLLSPLVKWGIFDPSHQLLTLTAILYAIFFKKNKFNLSFSNALLFGTLMLLHRTFLITFIWLLLVEIKNEINLKKIFKYSIYFLISLIPYTVTTLFKLYFTGTSYDANIDYWGQFIWIFDFVRGKIRFESEWHCVTIPENFYCYFNDNLMLIFYLGLPVIAIIYLSFKYKELIKLDQNLKNLLSLSVFLYLFWSFIGWYPPIRFSYYSIGNLVILLFAYFISHIKDSFHLSLLLFSYCIYMLNLNHWNSPLIVEFDNTIKTSYLFLIIFVFFDLRKSKKLN